MKKVIIHPEQTQTISIDSITDTSIVGIIWEDGHKSWVTYLEYEKYCGIRLGDQTFKFKWHTHSVKAYCEKAIAKQAQVFVFNTTAGLVKWLKS